MPKIVGEIKQDKKPFTGMLIVNDLSGNLQQFAVDKGKAKGDIVLQSNFYTLQFVSSDSPSVSSYPQYKLRVPQSDPIEFDKLEIEQLV